MFIKFKLQHVAYLLFIIIALSWLMIIGSSFVLPILFGAFFAISLNGLMKRIQKVLRSKIISILICYLLVAIPIIGFLYLAFFQLYNIVDTLPSIQGSLNQLLGKMVNYINENIPFLGGNNQVVTKEIIKSNLEGPLGFVQSGILNSSQVLFSIALSVLYSFFFLFYSQSIKTLIVHQFQKSTRSDIHETILKIKDIIESYIVGVAIVALILSVFNSIGLWIIGLDYALFWGVLAGILAIIPYLGTLIGGLLPFFYCLATSDYTLQPLAVAMYYFIIQQLEGNLITPKIVGNQVNLNPLVSIIALVFFGFVWGVAGVILALPFVSILRIVLLQFEETHAVALFMGSDVEKNAKKIEQLELHNV